MNFKLWLEQVNIEHHDDDAENAIASYLTKLLFSATKLYLKDKTQKFSKILQDVAQGTAKIVNLGSQEHPKLSVEITIPKEIGTMVLPSHLSELNLKARIVPVQKDVGASYGEGLIEIGINMTTLVNAMAFEDESVQHMLLKLQSQIHHECTHISSGVTSTQNKDFNNNYLNGKHASGSEEYNKGKIDYYTDPGEIRAHAKQYSIIYTRYYPGQPFEKDKMLKLSGIDPKIERYFKGLGEREGLSQIWGMNISPAQEQQLIKARDSFNQTMDYFVNQRKN